MESNVLTSIPGIDLFPIISLFLFVAVFAGLLVWFFLADRNRLADHARAPFENIRGLASTDETIDIHHLY